MKSLMCVLTTGMLVLLLTQCASSPHPQSQLPAKGTDRRIAGHDFLLKDSGFDIGYLRGHNFHRCTVDATSQGVLAKSYLDQHLLKESELKLDRYESLFNRLQQLITTVNDHSGDIAAVACRTPFKLSVRVGNEVRTANGCWSSHEAAQLHDLIKQLEFEMLSAQNRR